MDRSSVKNGISATTLQSFELFSQLSFEKRESITQHIRTRQYETGNFIISTRKPTSEVFFIIAGKVRVCSFANNGKQVYFEDLSPSQMFGELSAIDGGERSSDCIAVEDSLLAYLPQQEFLTIVQDYPEAMSALLLRLTAMLRQQMQRIYDFRACSVGQRVRFELLSLARDAEPGEQVIQVDSPPTHAEIADRIAAHREAVTREVSKLKQNGIISWSPGPLMIQDMGALLELASSGKKL